MNESAETSGLLQLGWQSFRHLETASIEPRAGINVIHGRNAAGKTSLLEAIHFLARSKSFLTHRVSRVIQTGASEATVWGKVDADRSVHRLGVRHGNGETRVRLNGRDVTVLSEAAWLIPLQVINTEAQRLLTDGPAVRRAFLNWGVFHVEHHYRDDWRRYQRALRQRNAALRHGDRRLAAAWEPEMAAAGEAVDRRRRRFLDELVPRALAMAAAWLPGIDLDWQFRAGWRGGYAFADVLAGARERELAQGFGLYGPHRADIRFTADGIDASGHLSRGQQKLLVAALKMALIEYWGKASTQCPILLIDDLPAELDAPHRQDLTQRLEQSMAQIFLTAIDADQLPSFHEAAWFHVEHGQVSQGPRGV
ncbi:DNA replication/repair protein RecF [Spiribacter onubensis]|uniref:DNA replication and repair protein RecF n=1 Tax=Spiribacter onubensis TaxID=3122420 RepID=A0ABV3SAG8_9GAMM